MSYLQTLAHDEAIAFIASLQSVKAHLSQELQWMEAQVQQKAVQLQGIATLLSEASVMGLVTVDTHSTAEAESVATTASPLVTETVTTQDGALEPPATANGRTSPVTTTESGTAAITALPVEKPSTLPRTQKGKAASANTSRGAKPSAITQTSAAKVTPTRASAPPAAKASQRGKTSGFQRFLKSPFRDQALTEAVSDILNGAAAPLSTDEVMAALYEGLPQADYQRVKHSLANILSVGRSKGAWKSTGRGRYAGNATTPER